MIILIQFGILNTIWHSKYNDNGNGGHDEVGTDGLYHLTFDLGNIYTFESFSYTPRQTGGTNGRFVEYWLYTGNTREIHDKNLENNYYIGHNEITYSSDSDRSTQYINLGKEYKARYVTIVGRSGDKYGSCADFKLYCGHEVNTLNRNGWQIESNTEYSARPIEEAIDGNLTTRWHSNYDNNGPIDSKPYLITIDLGSSQEFQSFSYTPRQDIQQTSGRITRYELYYGDDKDSLNTSAESGTNPALSGTFE